MSEFILRAMEAKLIADERDRIIAQLQQKVREQAQLITELQSERPRVTDQAQAGGSPAAGTAAEPPANTVETPAAEPPPVATAADQPGVSEGPAVTDLAGLWRKLVEDQRLAEMVPAAENASLEHFEQLVDIFAELAWWMHLIDRAVQENLTVVGQKHEGFRQLAHTLKQQRLELRSVLHQTFRLRGQTRLRQYCFHFLYKPIIAIPHGYRAAIIGTEQQLQVELNPKSWGYTKKVMETEEEAIGRHLQQKIRPDLPVSFSAFLRKMVAEKAYEGYNTIRMPSP